MRHRLARRLRQIQHPRSETRLDMNRLSPAVQVLLRSPSGEIPKIVPILLPRLNSNDQLQTLKLLCDKKMSDAANFVRRLSSPSPKILSTIVSAWMRDGNSKACLTSGLELIERGVLPTKNVLTTLIRAAGICHRSDIIHSLWQSKSMMGIKADSRMHAAHITACGRIGLDEFQKSYHDMIASGVLQDKYTYCALIHALGHLAFHAAPVERQFIADRSEKLFAEMLSGGIALTTISMNVLINTLCKCGEVERALRVLGHFRHRIIPDLFTYSPLLDSLASNGRIHACGRLIAEMLSQGIIPNGIVLSSLLNGSQLNGVKPFLVWQTYQLVVEQHKDVKWDNLARSVIIQSLQQSHIQCREPFSIQLLQDHFSRNQRIPGRTMVLPFILGKHSKELSLSKVLLALQEYGPDKSLVNHAFRLAIRLESVKLCLLLAETFGNHRIVLDFNTMAVLLTFLASKQVHFPYSSCTFLPTIEKLFMEGLLGPQFGLRQIASLANNDLSTLNKPQLRCIGLLAAAYGKTDLALHSLDKIFNPSLDNALLRIFSSSNDLFSVLVLLEKRPFLSTQPVLLDLYRRTKSINLIDQALRTIGSGRCCYDPLQIDRVIEDLARLGHIRRSYDWIHLRRQLFSTPIRSCSLYAALTLFSRSSLPEFCESVVSAVNPEPNLTCFNILINAYCKLGDANKIDQVRTRLRLAGLLEDIVTYNTLLCYALQTKQTSLIGSLYHDMKQLGLPVNSRTLTCLINASSLCSTPLSWVVKEIELYIGNNDPEPFLCEALIRVFGGEGYTLIQSRWPDVLARDSSGVVWASIIRLFGQAKARYHGPLTANIINALLLPTKSIQALKFFCKGVIAGKLPSNSHTFPALIRAFSFNGGNANDLMALFQKMLKSGYALNSATAVSMINALRMHDSISQCQEIFDLARHEALLLTEPLFTALIRAYARLGDIHSCQQLLDQMRQQNVTPTIETFNALLTACRVNGDVSLAHRMLSLLADLQLEPSLGTYRELLRLYAFKGSVEECQDVINHICKECDFEPDHIDYRLLQKAKAISRHGSGSGGSGTNP